MEATKMTVQVLFLIICVLWDQSIKLQCMRNCELLLGKSNYNILKHNWKIHIHVITVLHTVDFLLYKKYDFILHQFKAK